MIEFQLYWHVYTSLLSLNITRLRGRIDGNDYRQGYTEFIDFTLKLDGKIILILYLN